MQKQTRFFTPEEVEQSNAIANAMLQFFQSCHVQVHVVMAAIATVDGHLRDKFGGIISVNQEPKQ